jgi:hypothetical protein
MDLTKTITDKLDDLRTQKASHHQQSLALITTTIDNLVKKEQDLLDKLYKRKLDSFTTSDADSALDELDESQVDADKDEGGKEFHPLEASYDNTDPTDVTFCEQDLPGTTTTDPVVIKTLHSKVIPMEQEHRRVQRDILYFRKLRRWLMKSFHSDLAKLNQLEDQLTTISKEYEDQDKRLLLTREKWVKDSVNNNGKRTAPVDWEDQEEEEHLARSELSSTVHTSCTKYMRTATFAAMAAAPVVAFSWRFLSLSDHVAYFF